jgi:hypothetical protein
MNTFTKGSSCEASKLNDNFTELLNSTNGLIIPMVSAAPTTTPTTYQICFCTSDCKIYVYDVSAATWKSVALT